MTVPTFTNSPLLLKDTDVPSNHRSTVTKHHPSPSRFLDMLTTCSFDDLTALLRRTPHSLLTNSPLTFD
eukprot:5773143-Pleurochrysis_carterae.AAC.2